MTIAVRLNCRFSWGIQNHGTRSIQQGVWSLACSPEQLAFRPLLFLPHPSFFFLSPFSYFPLSHLHFLPPPSGPSGRQQPPLTPHLHKLPRFMKPAQRAEKKMCATGMRGCQRLQAHGQVPCQPPNTGTGGGGWIISDMLRPWSFHATARICLARPSNLGGTAKATHLCLLLRPGRAFDRVAHTFLFETLQWAGLATGFFNLVHALYSKPV